ncbi:MAG: radical SAM protein [Butyrivibrio sp.]|nr:radical SAM protein [Butyrivibrio sp.]
MEIIKKGRTFEYKPSIYNIHVPYPYNGGTILYNGITNGIALLSAEEYESFNKNMFSSEHIRLGFAVPTGKDEKLYLANERQRAINNPAIKRYAILTTTACNASCYYCFEKGTRAITMSNKTSIRVAKFILNQQAKTPTKRSSIMWFGGEPLVNTDAIDCIMGILHDNDVYPDCSITTNGSLITPKMVDKMMDRERWDIKSVQITLDGFEDVYNAAKNYNAPDKYSFSVVINNILLLLKAGIRVSIRLNYDTNNYLSLDELIRYLGNVVSDHEKSHLSVYINTILPTDKFPTTTIADQYVVELNKRLIEVNLSDIEKICRFGFKGINCPMSNKYAFSISPDGHISKCYEVTDRYPVGDIRRHITDLKTDALWTSGKIGTECEKCIYLPLCQGGCPIYKDHAHCTKSFNQMDILPELLAYYVHEKTSISQ